MSKNKFFYTCLCIVLVCFFIAGCTSYRSEVSRIQIGMTPQQVTSIMGRPRDRNINGNTERWFYWNGGNQRVWITFTDGRVSYMDTDV